MMLQTLRFIVFLSLVIGMTGMLLASDATHNESHIKVPVTTQNLPRGTLLTGSPIQGIELHLRGPAEILNTLPELKLHYVLDLTALGTGSHSVPIRIDQLNLPQGLSVVNIEPQSIQVQLETEIRKEVRVTVFFKGSPATGYFVAQTSATPEKVLIRGPKRALDEITSVGTYPVDVSGIAESFKKEITLDLPNDFDALTPRSPIQVTVTISEEIQTKHFSDILVQSNATEHNCEISPPVISMDVKGPVNLLETLTTAPDFVVYVDIKGLEPGVYVRRATIELPVATTLVGVSPEIFTVTISDKP